MRSRSFGRWWTTGAATCAAALALLNAVPAWAGDGPQEEEAVTVTQRIEHANLEEIERLLRNFDVSVTAESGLGVLAIRGPAARVEAAVAAARELDRPPKPAANIELKVYILAAAKEGSDGSELPAGIRPAAQALADTLGYRSFRLLDAVLLRARAGDGGSISGTLPNPGPDGVKGYSIAFRRAEVLAPASASEPRRIRLADLSFQAEAGSGFVETTRVAELRASLRTNVDVREGQTVVVGKAAARGVGEALVLMIEAQVVGE